jgi:hypothetical protein
MHTDLAANKDRWVAANLGIGGRWFDPNISVSIRVYPWLKPGSVAAPLLHVFRVFRGEFCSFFNQP